VTPGFVATPKTAAFTKGRLRPKPDTVARGIYRAIAKQTDIVYLPRFWWGIMALIRAIPERVFKRMTL
jgi:hypothetical protein